MSGRGDNNQHGSSGRGASNQSGQGQQQTDEREKMNHGAKTGTQPSEEQNKTRDQDSNRNTSVDTKKV